MTTADRTEGRTTDLSRSVGFGVADSLDATVLRGDELSVADVL